MGTLTSWRPLQGEQQQQQREGGMEGGRGGFWTGSASRGGALSGGAIIAATAHEASADVGHAEQGHRGRAEHERGRELRYSERVAQIVSRKSAKCEGYGHLGAEEQKVALEIIRALRGRWRGQASCKEAYTDA